MTIAEHPERVKAARRGDLAARMVRVACDLACLVREEDRDGIGRFLAGIGGEERTALLVVLAAMVPVDVSSPADLLSWVIWDEYGQPLPGPVRETPVKLARSGPLVLLPCGTYGAYRRHKKRGELVDDDCMNAAREYWQDRKAAKRKAVSRRPGRAA